MNYKTEQETFWAGEFGNDYVERNKSEKLLASKTTLFSKILSRTYGIESIIEFGANIGLNLQAIKRLLPDVELSSVEINKKAVNILEGIEGNKVYPISILDFKPDYQRDLTFTAGVLIHINPDKLNMVYKALYETSKRYILVYEYYNPVPVELEYRGNEGKLYKRDFAGELIEKYNLKLIDYGFTYRRDANFPGDDITWFLLEK